MRKVVVLSGVSGSGKSTYIREVLGLTYEKVGGEGSKVVVSADDYFTDSLGVYNFDPTKLSDAHGECFYNFIAHMRHGEELVVVDNTNTTVMELSPYILGAQAWKYEVEVVTLMCESEDDVKVCAARNSHGVPFGGVMAQHKRLLERSLPPWWKNTFTRPCF